MERVIRQRSAGGVDVLTDCGLRLRDIRKLNDAHSLGASALKQNLCELNLTGGFEELDEIFVGG